ncbi:phosphatidylserine decarboxylase [Halalkalibacter sp. AB-rgal2]|uniref:phosphatidylserine decarboxylase n=1 Tax=Halalkalibacter sp. AB-rgal2 TaxID=3242695 RepID=UPI00359DDAE0
MKKIFFRMCVELTNHRISSYLLKKFATSSLSKPLVVPFARTFDLNQEEMERPLLSYKNLHELFTRNLKVGSREVDRRDHAIVSPVDGVVAQVGQLNEGESFLIKGQVYKLEEMLESQKKAKEYANGQYVVLYLSPSHYHRIHAPVTATVRERWSLGKKSYPVNEYGLTYGKRPLSRNFRIVTEVEVNAKSLALVKVGAMNINTIELTNQKQNVEKGEELGYFSFGSTVVLLAEEGLLQFNELYAGQSLLMGESIGELIL